ncbi:hypothetical protein K523DRAFT_327862, partial [Schizophyllum commune Tattone D]
MPSPRAKFGTILSRARTCSDGHASKAARRDAWKVKEEVKKKQKNEELLSNSEDGEDGGRGGGGKRKKTKAVACMEESIKETKLEVYRGINIPFTEKQAKVIKVQTASATIPANLPFCWVEDIEILKLFFMMRTCAPEIIPAPNIIWGCLLDGSGENVEDEMKRVLKGKSVMLLCCFDTDQRFLTSLLITTAEGKDTPAMMKVFGNAIDQTEVKYGCL